MATKPSVVNTKINTMDAMNAIRSNASPAFRSAVPVATADNLPDYGEVVMQFEGFANEFLNALINRIGMVIISSKLYSNPWAMFKRGVMDMGETIEEIFANIAKPYEFNDGTDDDVFKRYKPDVRAAYHYLNYKKYYPVTIEQTQLRAAFTSYSAMSDLISKIIETLYTAANYDEYLVMLYLLGRSVLKGNLYPLESPAATKANAEDIAALARSTSNDLTFMKNKYNIAGVYTHTPRENQYVLLNTKFDGIFSVNVLANAFNMDKTEFLGHQVLFDGYANLDRDRLDVIFADDPKYQRFTDDELTQLDACAMFIIDRDFLMIYDYEINMNSIYNPKKLYWNYFLHTWKLLSISPFANAVAFVGGKPAVTGVTVTPSTATLSKGATMQFKANVATDNNAPQTVTWSLSSTLSTVDSDGNVTIGADETSGSITVTATSVFDPTKTGTATITVED